MGDSTTFGMELNSEETYPNITETTINKGLSKENKEFERKENSHRTNKHIEIINAGTPGYLTLQGLVLLKRKILKYKPDLITVSYGFNHFTFRKSGFEDKNFIGYGSWSNHLRFYLDKTMIYTLIKKFVTSNKDNSAMLTGLDNTGYRREP